MQVLDREGCGGRQEMAATLLKKPGKPTNNQCALAYQVLSYTHDTSDSFLEAFDTVRKLRKAVGTPTDEEQDLLRAMLVMASAGLDAVAKQLIRDCLLPVVAASDQARDAFQGYVERRLKGRGAASEELVGFDPKFAAAALVAPDMRIHLVESLAAELTSGSLQSLDELKRVAVFLAGDLKVLEARGAGLKSAFDARNQIIHEMDIDFSQVNRNRFSRTKKSMVQHANALLEASQLLISSVDDCLRSTPT
jgi:hypothetical protein